MKSLITGSYAYGTPREDSDIDLVVMVSADDMALLGGRNELQAIDQDYSGGPITACLRFGALNLICLTDQKDFEIWQEGTAELIARRPVTRDEAIEHFKEKRRAARDASSDNPETMTAGKDVNVQIEDIPF